MLKAQADFLIAGSGFSGSILALILQRCGHSVIVFDSQKHPRFAIGESSTPVADFVLRDLAEKYDLPRLSPLTRYGSWCDTYPNIMRGRKRGFSYFKHIDGEEFVPREDHANELLVAASTSDELSDTHWLRSDVDSFLADEVRAADIPLYENTFIENIQETSAAEDSDARQSGEDSSWLLSGSHGGEPVEFRGQFLIDATGGDGFLCRHLKIGDLADGMRTNSWSVYSHRTNVPLWEGFLRSHQANIQDHPYPCDAAALHHLFDDGWMWQLKFDNGITSAGLMFDGNRRPPQMDVAEVIWHDQLDRYPSVALAYWKSRLADESSGLAATARLQRRASQIQGKNWLLMPATAGFVDPLHSTGIGHSMCGIEFLGDVFSQEKRNWEAGVRAYAKRIECEIDLIDRLVAACYHALPDFRMFRSCTMLYFAATIAWEQKRLAGNSTAAFLCATDNSLCTVLDSLTDAAMLVDTTSISAVEQFEETVRREIAPWNTVGLFSPEIPNMYHHTAPV